MYKFGIIGFGVVGKSVLTFVNKQKFEEAASLDPHIPDETGAICCLDVCVWDSRALAADEQAFIKKYGAAVLNGSSVSLKDFIASNDFIIASPGVNLLQYQEYDHKFLCELDFFSGFYKKPTVAVTGSLGKTTVTKLLGKLSSILEREPNTLFGAQKNISVGIGGNVGIGMLDLVKQYDDYDGVILELSSFQLELSKKFAPDIAVWTNMYPNHLDRHLTLEKYFEAKFNLLTHQNSQQVLVITQDLLNGPCGDLMHAKLVQLVSRLVICMTDKPDQAFIDSINRDHFTIYYHDNNQLMLAEVHNHVLSSASSIMSLEHLPAITFKQNWIQVLTTLRVIGSDLKQLEQYLKDNQDVALLDDHHHRVELCATINDVDFYNDSKSTVIQATQAAVEKLSALGRPMIIMLGGLSKGVDRSPLMRYLATISCIKKIYFFGEDSTGLDACLHFPDLETALADVVKTMQPGDLVLFSPSGASFDFFKSYEHRGEVFKKMVEKLENK